MHILYTPTKGRIMKLRITVPFLIYALALIPTPTNMEDKGTKPLIPNKKNTYTETKKAPAVKYGHASGYDVVYVFDDSTKITRSGGSRAWRNSNPGNLRYTEKTRQDGAIGHAGGFAIFPDEETGIKALQELLKSDTYKKLSIAEAIMRYAPPHENDTQQYKKQLQKMTGLDIRTKIDSLNPEQFGKVMNAICVLEGWKTGTEIKNNLKNPAKQRTI